MSESAYKLNARLFWTGAIIGTAICMVLATCTILTLPASAQASTVRNFPLGTTVTSQDWTGDGKPDTLSTAYLTSGPWQASQGEFSGIVVRLNGKRAYTLLDTPGYRSSVVGLSSRVQRIALPGGRVLAALVTSYENGDGSCTFLKATSNGKLVRVGNPLKGFFKFGTHNSALVKSAKGNALTVSFHSMSYSLGGVSFSLRYRYSNGKVIPAQMTFAPKLTRSLKGPWTLWEPKKLYTTAACSHAKTTLPKGTKTHIAKIYLGKDHKKNAVKVKTGKRTGWLKGYTKPRYKFTEGARYGFYNGLFTQVIYAG